ncbi:hypothetical protein [Okeania hirsuta]|uniref:hypothetical protein n=1 Tax=Okeania hirsuta TaxID=1458930 RepID=UPI000F5429CA|nr:hypothetical protein [Okeania hirsuta]
MAKIEPLRDEILQLRYTTNQKSLELLARIDRIEQELLTFQKPVKEVEKKAVKPPAEFKASEVRHSPSEKENVSPAALITAASYSTKQVEGKHNAQIPPVRKQIKKEPIELPIWLQLVLAPLLQIIAYLKGVHKHYKAEGRLPVFFLSLGESSPYFLGLDTSCSSA